MVMTGKPSNLGIIHAPPQTQQGSQEAPSNAWAWLFVYGTLKRGHRHHQLLVGAGFGGEARAHGLRLYDLGPFPMAIEEAGFHIEGELFRVPASQLQELDRFEGAPRLYERILWPISPIHSSPPHQAWIYRGHAHQVRHVAAIGPRYEPSLPLPQANP